MVNQEKSGRYIAEKRKQLGMTQKDLAERVGLTDKAVSKWERGKSMPDSSVLNEICDVLNISFNEYISGEDIEEEHYSDIAEENMRELIRENSGEKKKRAITFAGLLISLLFALVGTYGMFLAPDGKTLSGIALFIDIPSAIQLFGAVLLCAILSGAFFDLLNAFVILFQRRAYTQEAAEKVCAAIELVRRLNVAAGSFLTVGQLVIAFSNEVDEALRPVKISLSLLPLWYGLLWNLLLVPFRARLRRTKRSE